MVLVQKIKTTTTKTERQLQIFFFFYPVNQSKEKLCVRFKPYSHMFQSISVGMMEAEWFIVCSSSFAISECFSTVNGASEGRLLQGVKVAMKAASGCRSYRGAAGWR